MGGASFCDLTDSSSSNTHVTIDDFKSVGGHNKKEYHGYNDYSLYIE